MPMNGLLQLWQHWGALLIGTTLALISLGFIVRFIIPAWLLDRELKTAASQLQALAGEENQPDRPQRSSSALATPHLQHLWREYAQTLHRHEQPGQATNWRATAMAGQFFTEQALVDTPLKTGFYKHLPGILTGIGIIGTFSGLIVGLAGFQVSSEAEAVRSSLHDLIRSVGHAFEISAIAITLAMVFTWIEKSLTTRLYRRVEQLGQLIDQLFDAGVGEEYLARLVRASEAAAQHGAQLRQALVTELRLGMQAMIAEQQQSARQQHQTLAGEVGEAVARSMESSLGEPLRQMTRAVESLGSKQEATLGLALEQALERFSKHLDQSLGERQGGLERLLTQTSQALNNVVGELGRVSARLESAGRGAVESAAGQLQSAGNDVHRASASFARISEDMALAANAMSAAAQTASQSVTEQARLRESIIRLVGDLRSTVEAARRDASLTSELVSRIEQATHGLVQAETQAGDYLQAVNQVLGEAHSAFADNIEQTLSRGNQQFQRSVVGAVEALEGAIEELSDALHNERAAR
jgi:hypothetical protein